MVFNRNRLGNTVGKKDFKSILKVDTDHFFQIPDD